MEEPGQTLREHDGQVNAIAFSPDGDYLATVSADHHGIIWHARSAQVARVLRGHSAWVGALAWQRLAACGSLVLATGSHDARAIVWAVDGARFHAAKRDKAQLRRVLRGHGGAVLALAFDSRGAWLASASCDKTVALWCTRRDERVRVLNHAAEVWTCAFAPACDDRADDGEGTDATPSSAGGSANAREGSVSGSHADSDDDEREDPYARSGAAACARAAARRRLLATGCRDQRVLLWDARAGTLLAALDEHPEWVLSLAFSPAPIAAPARGLCAFRTRGGSALPLMLATASHTRLVIVRIDERATARGAPSVGAITRPHGSNWVTAVAFAPARSRSPLTDGDVRWLATASADRSAIVWRVVAAPAPVDGNRGGRTSDAPLSLVRHHAVRAHADWLAGVALHCAPDGGACVLATCSWDRTAKLWPIGTLAAAMGPEDSPNGDDDDASECSLATLQDAIVPSRAKSTHLQRLAAESAFKAQRAPQTAGGVRSEAQDLRRWADPPPWARAARPREY